MRVVQSELEGHASDLDIEARLFEEAEIPWDDLAFKTVIRTLRWFVADRKEGRFSLHTDSIVYQPKAKG